MDQLRVAVIGTGTISGIYLKNLMTVFADRISVIGCADLLPQRARETAEEYGLAKAYETPGELLSDPDVDLVLNLTVPAAHYDVNRAAVEAGKHVYVEKPLCNELHEASSLLAAAADRGVHVGGAPDTFLGAGQQTCRTLIDDGMIGNPIAAAAFMQNHGPESWHPAPEFYYKVGGGPMFDMGPYYLTALINLVGPVKSVTGSTRTTFPQRTTGNGPRRGTVIDVEVPTHVTGILDFANGAVGTIVTSFDVWSDGLPCIEIYGTEGSLSVPDPNTFGGEIKVRRSNDDQWRAVEPERPYSENSRGIGVVEMAEAIQSSRPHRASAGLMQHVLEIMHGIHIAADNGTRYEMQTNGVRPEALPADF